MEKNSQNFSMDDAMRLARSPAARQLFDLMQAKNPEAMSKAASGDYGKLQQDLSAILADPEIRELLQRLGG